MQTGPIILSLELAGLTTVILLILCIPLGYWLAFSKFRFKVVVEALMLLPMVLPPTVLGFYLMVGLAPDTWLGRGFESIFGFDLLFSFFGILISCVVFSLPFMLQAIVTGFKSIPDSVRDSARLSNKSKFAVLWNVMLPSAKQSVITGALMTFAHTLGAFGVVLMVGGSIPGSTKVASVAIYDAIEVLDYSTANQYSLTLLILSFVILISIRLTGLKTKVIA